MEYNQLIANSTTAFGSGNFEVALKYAKKAIDSEPGSHTELMALNGKYAEMWNVQAEKYCASIYA